MKKLVLFVVACLMAVSLQAARCAVLGFESAASVSITQVDGIDAMFMTYFQPAGYIMVDRHDFEVLLEEQDLQSSDLTTDQMVEMGRILNVSKIVRGTVSMLGGFYQVDVRVVDVETSTYISDGTTFRGDNYRENVKTLATRLAAKVAIRPGAPVMPSQITPTQPTPPTTTPPTQPTPPTQTPAPAPVEPYVLYGYLKIFPNDLGTFETEPKTIIARLNQNKQYGYSTWRLPTNEELALMKANNIIMGNSGNYMTREHPSGILRLVTDKEKGDTIAVASPTPTHQNFIETASGLNMKMIWVEGGGFMMGCTNEQGNDCEYDEMNVHRVTMDGFYIGMLEVTQTQWMKIMGTTIQHQSTLAGSNSQSCVGDDYPMCYVSWGDADEFCRRLSILTNQTYTLPTEAQWEYAARGGQSNDGTKYSGSNMLDAVGWYSRNSRDSRNSTRPHVCGTKQANSLGIYDMSGNVWEWCKDWYTSSYETTMTANPAGPSTGSDRVVRGGGCGNSERCCRVSDRDSCKPNSRGGGLGFRVVLLP